MPDKKIRSTKKNYSRRNIIGGGKIAENKLPKLKKLPNQKKMIPDQTSLMVGKKLPDKKYAHPKYFIPDETSLVVENKSRLQRTRHHQRLSWLRSLH